MKLLPFLLVLLFGGCQSPNNTSADNKAIAQIQRDLIQRGFVLLDGVLTRVVPLPSTRGFAK